MCELDGELKVWMEALGTQIWRFGFGFGERTRRFGVCVEIWEVNGDFVSGRRFWGLDGY